MVIGAGKKAELRLVPMTAGSFYPDDTPFWLLGIQEGKPAFIYVED